MKHLYIAILLMAGLSHNATGQDYCSLPNAFISASSPQSIDTFTVYTDTVITYYNKPFTVKLKMAVPVNDVLPFAKRPLVIGVHGGGFVSDSMGPGLSTQAYISVFNQFAAIFPYFGFATASLDYRTGFGILNEYNFSMAIGNPGSAYCNTMDAGVMQHLNNAAYRATADCRSAVDYIFSHPEQFPTVDTNQIYLYGMSAGAITVLHAAFTERDEFYPDSLQIPALAPKHKLAGILSFAGALTDNTHTPMLNQIDADENTPVFIAHGTIDPIVPYNRGALGMCNNIPNEYWWNGSEIIAERMCELGMNYELFLADGAAHDLGSQYPVNNKMGVAALTFIKNRGICPQGQASTNTTYNLQDQILSYDTCVPGTVIGIYEAPATSVKLYPNPTNDYYINVCTDLAGADMLVYNSIGQQLAELQLTEPCHTLNMQQYGKGMYFYAIKQGTANYYGKFIVE